MKSICGGFDAGRGRRLRQRMIRDFWGARGGGYVSDKKKTGEGCWTKVYVIAL